MGNAGGVLPSVGKNRRIYELRLNAAAETPRPQKLFHAFAQAPPWRKLSRPPIIHGCSNLNHNENLPTGQPFMLLHEPAVSVAKFHFAEVQFFHLVFNFRTVAHGHDGDLLRMNIFLRRRLSLLGTYGVHSLREF